MEDKTRSLHAEYTSLNPFNRTTVELSVGRIDLSHVARDLSYFFSRTSFCSLNDSLIVGANLHHSKTVYLVVRVSGAISPEVLLCCRWLEKMILN